MKKLISLFLVGMFLIFCGCGMLQPRGDSQELIAKISARHIGHELVKKHPKIANELLYHCRFVTTALINNTAVAGSVERMKRFLLYQWEWHDDPLMEADIDDLLSLIKIDGPEIPESRLLKIRAVIDGLSSGLRTGLNDNSVEEIGK